MPESRLSMTVETDRLRQLREVRGWTQQELADMCGVNKLQVHRYETGITAPPADKLRRLAEVFGVSSDYLLGLTDDPQVLWRDPLLNDDERAVIDVLRREGWPGVAKLSVERLTK